MRPRHESDSFFFHICLTTMQRRLHPLPFSPKTPLLFSDSPLSRTFCPPLPFLLTFLWFLRLLRPLPFFFYCILTSLGGVQARVPASCARACEPSTSSPPKGPPSPARPCAVNERQLFYVSAFFGVLGLGCFNLYLFLLPPDPRMSNCAF